MGGGFHITRSSTATALLSSSWTLWPLRGPLAIVLLLKAPKAGLLLALVIMVTDGEINSAVSYMYLDRGGAYAVNYVVQLQSVFLGFLLGSAPFVGRYVSRQDAA